MSEPKLTLREYFNLIGAAPDLLNALENLLHLFDEECYGMPRSFGGPAACRAARAAIAKARGEEEP